MTYGQRLEKAMTHAKKTRAELAAALDCAPQTIGIVITWTGDKERTLSTKNHEAAARFLKVSPRWLLTEEGQMLGHMEQDAQPPVATMEHPAIAQTQAPDDWPFDPDIVSRQMYEALSDAGKTIVQVKLLEAIREEVSQSAKQQQAHKTRTA
jgi:hypothetical protein